MWCQNVLLPKFPGCAVCTKIHAIHSVLLHSTVYNPLISLQCRSHSSWGDSKICAQKTVFSRSSSLFSSVHCTHSAHGTGRHDVLIAVAMTMVLIVRGLVLSVGSVLALASVVMALLMRDGIPVLPSLIVGLMVALACGLVNGLLIAKAGILPFLVTLGMMSIARGLATVLTTGQYISFPHAARWFSQFGRYELSFSIGNTFYGFPVLLLVTLATITVFGLLLSYWTPSIANGVSNAESPSGKLAPFCWAFDETVNAS